MTGRRRVSTFNACREILDVDEQREQAVAHDNELEPTDEGTLDRASTRRALLGRGAVAAAAAAAAGIAIAKPAAATDGNNVVIGAEGHTAQTPTEVLASGFSGGVVLLVNETAFTAFDSNYPAVLGGWGDQRTGVYGYTLGSGATAAVVGRAPSGVGVYGLHSGTAVDGPGVLGESSLGVGVVGKGNVADFKSDGNGFIWMAKPGVAPNPTGVGGQGAIARDAAGSIYYCYENGKWRKLAGAATAGSFHPITPVRVYDSRAAAPTPGAMAPNANRLISIKDGRAAGTGAVNAADAVPVGATAVAFNVTATGTTGPNYLSIVPGDVAGFSTSTLNWAGGYDIANGGTVKVDANRQIKVFMGDQTGSAHVIIDITGYYL
jgi:hypothetical protein